ncbi:glycerol kinase [Neomicrococcus aestuarii]|uniref:Glycerol kinase n=1 Tax=Neomicrococcus aestuarii TaxID=556325 RepID=A0A7W8WZ59_9MICC|nr:glycerol kinase GlpK [Neomicrococcus aestuarii]MBB5511985.1 glycerol kinase [Neomicrococcus aestuarii]
MSSFMLAIDQGTTSTRAVIYDVAGKTISSGQTEHRQIFAQPGWVEHDASEIWSNTREVVGMALAKANLTRQHIAAVGITNQRETTVLWDKRTGQALGPAIVWQDTRTQDFVEKHTADGFAIAMKDISGLRLNTYFSVSKLAWLLDNVPKARALAEAGHAAFGTIDSWILWNMTGGADGGVHATDVTNASRTGLMDIYSCTWSAELCNELDIPLSVLPEIKPSSGHFGVCHADQLLRDTPITGILGDQQAATFGQAVFEPGAAKNTYGTGCFFNFVTGETPVVSTEGLLTTVAYQLEGQRPVYGLEGSVAVAGSLVQWLRDNLGIISSSSEVEALAESVPDNGGVFFVPAFSGLYAPYWRPEARGAIQGLTRFATKAHLARAAIESTAFQVHDVVACVSAEKLSDGGALKELRVDGGMAVNNALMQFQADILGIDVIRPQNVETTSLGAAFAAGLAVGFWEDLDALRSLWSEERRFTPSMDEDTRKSYLGQWNRAVGNTVGWLDPLT